MTYILITLLLSFSSDSSGEHINYFMQNNSSSSRVVVQYGITEYMN